MIHVVVSVFTLSLLAFADGALAPSPPGVTVIPFRTDAAPRIDPVFGDVTSLRAAIDRFLSLQGEMDRVRDECSSAVHAALAALVPLAPTGTGNSGEARACPAAAAAPYARASAAGGRYLALGQQLQAAYREIRRGDELGDTVGLTPDYRLKVKKARELHQQLLSDYREMRVAFYDQLGAEMRHAGCRLPARGSASPALDIANPADPSAWDLGEAAAGDGEPTSPSLAKESASRTPAPAGAAVSRSAAGPASAAAEAPAASGAAPAIWIEIDNTLCNEPTRLSIDGQAMGDIGARNETSVRTRSGPHEVCALPASDRRACGDAGTLRKAYLHEGWRLSIHCQK